MSKYLIDTDICIHYLRGKYGIKEKIRNVEVANCFISEITIAELTFGAYRSNNFEKHIREVAKMEDLFVVLPIYSAISIFAKEKERLQRKGKLIPDFDLLIGATSIENDLLMVTNNEKHLSRLNGIQIVNWTKSEHNKFI